MASDLGRGDRFAMSSSIQASYDDVQNAASSDEEDTGGAILPSASDLLDGAMFSTSRNAKKASKKNGPSVQGKKLVNKIHAILAEPNYSSIISWNDAGDAFIIHDVDAFVSTVMPMHFQHSKFDSFIRRMRRWGFRAVKPRLSSFEPRLNNAMEFSSKYFIRDRPDLWSMMRDERMNTKQFEFLDHGIKNTSDFMESDFKRFEEVMPTLESMIPIPNHYPQPSESLKTSQQPKYKQMMPSLESTLPPPVHYPQSSSNLKSPKQPVMNSLQMHYPQAHSNLNSPKEQEYVQQMPSYGINQQLPMNYPPLSSNLKTPQQTEYKMLPFLDSSLQTPIHYPQPSSSLKPPRQRKYQQSEMLPKTKLTISASDGVGTTSNLQHSLQPTLPPTMPPPYPYSYGVTPLRVPGFKTSRDRGHQKLMSIMDARASSLSASATLLSSSSEESSELELLPSPTNKAKRQEKESPPSAATSNV